MNDKLEYFKQKLKIAVRKNKTDKIAKYEMKIKDINDCLNGDISLDKNSTILTTDADEDQINNDVIFLHLHEKKYGGLILLTRAVL